MSGPFRPPSRKYQSDGGPNLRQMLELLKGSDAPEEDRRTLLKAQLFFWLVGAMPRISACGSLRVAASA